MLTAATGMDAVSHCIECFISPVDNPLAAAIAIDGLDARRALLARGRRRAGPRGAAGDDDAAIEGALAFQKGLGAVHALSHAAGRAPRDSACTTAR